MKIIVLMHIWKIISLKFQTIPKMKNQDYHYLNKFSKDIQQNQKM